MASDLHMHYFRGMAVQEFDCLGQDSQEKESIHLSVGFPPLPGSAAC